MRLAGFILLCVTSSLGGAYAAHVDGRALGPTLAIVLAFVLGGYIAGLLQASERP